ncbi:MAG: OmpA family protein [Saprospiraceae bacterium]
MKHILFIFFTLISTFSIAQNVNLEGYVFEKGNRGYLNVVRVLATHNGDVIGEAFTNNDGFFNMEVPANSKLVLLYSKDMFNGGEKKVNVGKAKTFVKIEMGRSPGYIFEITLAEKRESIEIPVDAIKGARIEVYNKTTKEEVMDLIDHPHPEFRINLVKGNHYIILIRKNGFLSKRMEAKVNVEGCILCFEGVGRVTPGIADNLTEGNDYGVLLANVEMERIFEGKKLTIQNILYETNKWKLTGNAMQEMTKVITLMKDNPNLTLQLGSHTDSRGKSASNKELSEKRAKAAVEFLIKRGEINRNRISSYGYGEESLINKCRDGVKCTTEEHAANRRTELRIVGITDLKDVKSLAQMMKSIEMESMIEELMNQEEIKVSDGDNLEKAIEKREGTVVKNSINRAMTKEENETRVNNERKRLIDLKNAKPKLETTDKTGRVGENLPDSENLDKDKENDMAGLDVVNDSSIVESNGDANNGVKIIVLQSRTILQEDHAIFSTFDNIEIHRTSDSRLFYMIGGYDTTSDAILEYNSKIVKNYPKAFLASFKNGIMTMINQ